MGVGPPGRAGRDQIERVRRYLARADRVPGALVAVACGQGAGALEPVLRAEGAVPYPVDCAGNLHTSVIELLLRGGAAGVLVLPCHPRDCRNREGPKWLEQRLYHGREAELQERVDRRRISVAPAGLTDGSAVAAAVRRFWQALDELDRAQASALEELDLICERPPLRPKSRR
jgi:coenzyme F420-reducing hydrogenase delta subunit